jgi:hypothetical protein
MCQSYGLQNTEGVIFYQYASPNGLLRIFKSVRTGILVENQQKSRSQSLNCERLCFIYCYFECFYNVKNIYFRITAPNFDSYAPIKSVITFSISFSCKVFSLSSKTKLTA